jgi:hypothetical protein
MLVQTFRPYLYLYYLFHYEALEYGIMDQYENILYAKLKEAYAKYPLYGTRKAAVQKYGELPKSAFAMDDNNQISIVPKEPEPEPEANTTHDSTVDSSSEMSTIPISTTSSSNSNSSSDLDNPVLDSTPEPELSHVDDSLRPTIGSVASFVASNIARNNEYIVNDDDIHDWLRRFLEIGPEIWTSPSPSSPTVNRSMLYRASTRSSRNHNTSTNTRTRTSTRTTNTTTNANEKITEYNVSDIFYTECLAFNSWNIY